MSASTIRYIHCEGLLGDKPYYGPRCDVVGQSPTPEAAKSYAATRAALAEAGWSRHKVGGRYQIDLCPTCTTAWNAWVNRP